MRTWAVQSKLGKVWYPYAFSDCSMQAGLDSLGAVELRNALMAEFGIAVSATEAFDHSTPAALAAHVAATLAPAGNTKPFEVRLLQHITTLIITYR